MKYKEFVGKFVSSLNLVKRDLVLLFTGPIEYIYTFTISNSVKVKIEPHNNSTEKVGFYIINKLKSLKTKIYLKQIGSTVLKIPGNNDVDFIAYPYDGNLHNIIPNITKIFGSPKKVKKEFVQWEFKIKEVECALLLAKRGCRLYKRISEDQMLLQSNQNNVHKYVKMKLASDRVSFREY